MTIWSQAPFLVCCGSTCVPAWDHLQDELILRIFFLLPLRDLVRTSVACRRWHRLAFDESLWHSVDLHGVINTGLALEQVLKTGVRRLSCPGVHIDNRYLSNMCRLKITEMDLSMTEINTTTLERIIDCCTRLECLSLSGMNISCGTLLLVLSSLHLFVGGNILLQFIFERDAVSLKWLELKICTWRLRALSYNRRLRQLNLSGCHGFSVSALTYMLRSCSRSLLRPALHRPSAASTSLPFLSPSCRIQHFNMSGCHFLHFNDIMKSIFNNVSSTVTHLDVSGAFCSASLDDLNALVKRCPDIRTLHFNNNWRISIECLPVLSKLKHLVHLSLNGCLGLDVAAITDVRKTFPSLKYLDVMTAENIRKMSSLEKANPGVCINLCPSFVVASPTQRYESVGDLRMWDRTIRLRFTPWPLARI
ncbi:S-phase kinase-associated protein 2-like isoform X2 [Phyllopteryx taeniolatus]|uniref:S-phase kinase-associated protein 2-like isoform X2 n=1 Tax=Phyllopteryx taeniolatus TaxID=161469 RepID=UPI002AD2151B|nr:S-phase kinase-associated protein 2-like isoform X2 [Phyllopteryx taeniolatus]